MLYPMDKLILENKTKISAATSSELCQRKNCSFEKETVVYPFVPCEEKLDIVTVSKNDFVEILSYVEESGLSAI